LAITTIALHVELDTLGAVDASIALPLALAEAHSAHVTALVFAASGCHAEAAQDASGMPEAEQTAREDSVALHVRSALDARGLRFEVRGRSSFAYGVGEVLADQMRVSDLGIVSFGSGADMGKRWVTTGGIFSSGRPMLLVPSSQAAASVPRRIVVAWDASPAAVRAVHGALPFMKQAEMVTVVSVTDDKEFRSGQSAVGLTHLLARHGAKAEFQPVQRGSGGVMPAILDVARNIQADMLVMGAVRHAPLHNLLFGSATQDLLDRGPAMVTLLAA